MRLQSLAPATARETFLAVYGELFPRGEWPLPKLEPILQEISVREFEAGFVVLREGQSCASVPFVIEGSIRVYKTAESGREITLYRIERGQSCILSSGCATGISSFPATVVATKPTVAAFLPSAIVNRLLAEGPAFRSFILDQYSRRMADVIELVEEVAFRHLDERLRQWLSGRASPGPDRRVSATHQEIADHLGSSREVVSRILKDWEERGALALARGEIVLLPGYETLAL